MEKEKKKISCSYALLVVILFAVVCFLVDYIVIDRKLNENKGGSSTNSSVSENANNGNDSSNVSSNSNGQYTYDNIAGKYSAVVPVLIEELNEYFNSYYTLQLYNDGTYEYSYGFRSGFGEAGNYIIKDNMIVLNRSFVIGSNGGIMDVSFEKNIITMDNFESISGTFNNLINSALKGKQEVTLKKDASYDDNDSENSSYKQVLNNFTIYNEANHD